MNHAGSLRLEATVRVLDRWKQEMDWRLLHGALAKEQWRKSSVAVPRFPQMNISLPIEDRVQKIVAEVQPLIDEMLASMTTRSTGKSEATVADGWDEGIAAPD